MKTQKSLVATVRIQMQYLLVWTFNGNFRRYVRRLSMTIKHHVYQDRAQLIVCKTHVLMLVKRLWTSLRMRINTTGTAVVCGKSIFDETDLDTAKERCAYGTALKHSRSSNNIGDSGPVNVFQSSKVAAPITLPNNIIQ